MKSYMIIAVVCAVAMLILPVILLREQAPSKPADEAAQPGETSSPQAENTFTVYLTDENRTETVSYFDYTCASVAAEMPITYHEEALKCQAVACFTNALRLKASASPENMLGADISDNPDTHQGYMPEAERKEKWGKNYEKYETKLENAVRAVEGLALTYDGELCTAAFSAICTGTTESAENVWGSAIPYLVSVKSSGDTLSPAYSAAVSFNREKFTEAAKGLGISITDKTDFKKEIKITDTSKAGTVLKMKICGKEVTGAEAREAFALGSAAFEIKCTETGVTFTVRGCGHGVGMSQYGADYMARQGSSYDEILKHYYKGVEIEALA